MPTPFTLDQLIDYLEKTTDAEWLVDRVRSGSRNCVMGHVFDFGGGDNGGGAAWDFFEGAYATTWMIYKVNDGTDPRYPQATPKRRVIAYLEDLRDGKEKTSAQLWDEYEPAKIALAL